MEANNKMSTNFVENFLNGCPFSSLDLNYEKPEVVKKNMCNGFIKNQLNATCPMKQIVENAQTNGHANDENHCHMNCAVNGQTNGHTVNVHTNGHQNGHTVNGHKNENLSNGHNSEQKKPLIYGDYLMLDKLLSCQEPITRTMKEEEAHDEHLFIVTHQSYEIWFKQILWELNSVQKLITKKIEAKTDNNFTGEYVSTIKYRLHRMAVILKHLVNQWEILETMTPSDFIEFRAYLKPASGFQSLQFRLMENKLGLRQDHRVNYGKCNYVKVFQDKNNVNSIKNSENEESLYDLIEKWLERDCLTDVFINRYLKAVNRMFEQLEAEINEETNTEMKQHLIEQYLKKQQLFDQLTNEERYNQLIKRGDRRLSFKAFKTAICIFLNKEEFNYSMIFQILTVLQDIDTLLNDWRARHVHIVLKMIGKDLKGTGGSSGYQYLKSTLTDRYKIFTDFLNMGSYLVPRMYMRDYD